jgi:hypothetical protein
VLHSTIGTNPSHGAPIRIESRSVTHA